MVSDENGAKFTIFRLTVVFLEEAIRRKRFTLEPLYVSSEPLKAEVQNSISIVDDGFDHQRLGPSVNLSQPPRPRLQVRLWYIWGVRHVCQNKLSLQKEEIKELNENIQGVCYVFVAERSAVCIVSLLSRHWRAWLNQTNQSLFFTFERENNLFFSLLQKLGKRKGSPAQEKQKICGRSCEFRGSVTIQGSELSMILQLWS